MVPSALTGLAMLDGVRPGERRSWWLREALESEEGALAGAAPPLRGTTRCDVAIVGGGYTGLWAALRLTELVPGARIVLIESDICGGGPSGRNGGFVTSWWDELPALIHRYGEPDALAVAHTMSDAVDDVGAWCAANDVDAWFVKAGAMQASAAPAQDGGWSAGIEAAARMGVGDEYRELTRDEARARCDSPVFRGGVFMRQGATVQPARLVRAMRRVALARGVVIHEGTRALPADLEAVDGRGAAVGDPVPPLAAPAGGRTSRAALTLRTSGGKVLADQVILALNAWAAGWPRIGSRLVTWSSYIAMTEPIPDRLAELGWVGGEGLSDARFTLHYLRTTPDGRIAIGGGGGRAGYGGRIGRAFTHDLGSVERAVAGLRRLFPSLADVRIEDAWGGPIDIAADHLPFVGSIGPSGSGATARIHYGHGYSGNGVGPSFVLGRVLAARAARGLGAAADPAADSPLTRHRPRAFPPEPFRSVGARVIREAIVRRELAEEAGREPGRVVAALSRLPRRLGYHLGPE